MFQSTAGPMTGCNCAAGRLRRRLEVSIHSRPHDRLQHDRPGGVVDEFQFQSTAGPMTGCNHNTLLDLTKPACFNPQPAP